MEMVGVNDYMGGHSLVLDAAIEIVLKVKLPSQIELQYLRYFCFTWGSKTSPMEGDMGQIKQSDVTAFALNDKTPLNCYTGHVNICLPSCKYILQFSLGGQNDRPN
jgi:hypothetical protein